MKMKNNLFDIIHYNGKASGDFSLSYSSPNVSVEKYYRERLGEVPINLEIRESSNSLVNILYIHGISSYCKSNSNTKFLDFMTRLGYNTFGVDLYAHGGSGGKRGDFKMKDLIDSVHTASSFIDKNFNEKIAIVGDSLGGEVCFYSSLTDEKIKALVVHCPFLNSETSMDWRVRCLKNPFTYKIGKFLKAFPDPIDLVKEAEDRVRRVHDEEHVKQYIEERSSDKLRVRYYKMDSFRSIFTYQPNVRVDSMKIPMYVIVGNEDDVIPAKHQKKIYDLLNNKGVKVELTILKDAGHSIFREKMEETASLIDQWLRKRF